MAATATAKKLSGNLSIVQWSHFVPAYDTFFDAWAKDWGTKNGVNVSVDHIAIADLPARAAAEAAAKSGHDIFGHFAQGLPALYENSLVDITDICDAVGKKYGGWLPSGVSIGKVGAQWRGLPDFVVPFPSLWRKDVFAQAGYTKDNLETWQDLLDYAPKLKALGHPVGTAVSQTSDAEHTWRSLMWSYGAAEFSTDGKSVAIDSPETRTVLQFGKDLYQHMEPAVLSWGDVDNNTYLQSGKASWIYNPISAYRTIEKQNPDLIKNIYVSLPMKGPKAQICSIQFTVYGVWNFSKNIDAARQFLIDYSDNWEAEFKASEGYDNPFLKDHAKKPMPVLGSDPKLASLQDIPTVVQAIGYPGPATKAAFDSLNTHIVTDMFANYITGKKSIGDSIADASKRLTDSLAKFK
ncbi:MAG TPA: extracellular solute-binding protein [Candidatus Limnocylindria bacterium]|nr:extracellular solute-binding protein [Candidatus Limnocylindria bacterium]